MCQRRALRRISGRCQLRTSLRLLLGCCVGDGVRRDDKAMENSGAGNPVGIYYGVFWGKYRFQGVTDISARGKFRLVFENQYLSQSFPSCYTNSKEKAQVWKFLKKWRNFDYTRYTPKTPRILGRSKKPRRSNKIYSYFLYR